MSRKKQVDPESMPEELEGVAEEAAPEPPEEPTAAPAEPPGAESLSESEVMREMIPLEQHQRLLAEFDNYRKRTDRERERTGFWARAELLREILPVLDDMNRARGALKPKEKTFDRDGILIIMDRLAEVLKGEGLELIETSSGDVFDPEIHEAVLTVPSAELPEGRVADVLEKGYRVGDRLLRPAKVVVTRAPDVEPATK